MTYREALRVLGLPLRGFPTPDQVRAAFYDKARGADDLQLRVLRQAWRVLHVAAPPSPHKPPPPSNATTARRAGVVVGAGALVFAILHGLAMAKHAIDVVALVGSAGASYQRGITIDNEIVPKPVADCMVRIEQVCAKRGPAPVNTRTLCDPSCPTQGDENSAIKNLPCVVESMPTCERYVRAWDAPNDAKKVFCGCMTEAAR
jgi:hypothetical protein